MGIDWDNVTEVIGRITVGLGVLLALLGMTRLVLQLAHERGGIETLATIEAAAHAGQPPYHGGRVDLSWRDATGAVQYASGIVVSSALSRKLKIGRPLSRSFLRIRYQPDTSPGQVWIVEEATAHMPFAAAVGVAGFLVISAGSLLILWSLFQRGRRPTGDHE